MMNYVFSEYDFNLFLWVQIRIWERIFAIEPYTFRLFVTDLIDMGLARLHLHSSELVISKGLIVL